VISALPTVENEYQNVLSEYQNVISEIFFFINELSAHIIGKILFRVELTQFGIILFPVPYS